MVIAHPDTELDRRHLTIDYSSGHVLIDGRPIGTFVAEQGPEIVASPAPDLYVVNVPMLVKSVTFLPSGEHFTARASFSRAVAGIRAAFSQMAGPPVKYSADDVRLALAQAIPDRFEIERVMNVLSEVAP
ncbi:hypothetical protein [Dietzia alimentaria]|uniref:hypothetical protein n=1 Tax=Dietzia alimentaria TaxID=665550 RepID=UPI00029AF729|nr:hypothetical protein [Dietzia alimentaria]